MNRISCTLLTLSLLLVIPIQAHVTVLTWSYGSPTGIFFNIYRFSGTCTTAPVPTTPVSGGWKALSLGNLSITHYIDASVVSGDSYCYYVTAGIPDSSESVPSNTSGDTVPTGVISIAPARGLATTVQ